MASPSLKQIWHTDTSTRSRSQISKKDYQQNWPNSWHLIKAPGVSGTLTGHSAFTHKVHVLCFKNVPHLWWQDLHVLFVTKHILLKMLHGLGNKRRNSCVFQNNKFYVYVCLYNYSCLIVVTDHCHVTILKLTCWSLKRPSSPTPSNLCTSWNENCVFLDILGHFFPNTQI